MTRLNMGRIGWVLVGISLAMSVWSTAQASDADYRAVWGASALAMADYHRKLENRCEWWEVDEAAVEKVILWSGLSAEQLRASEDYKEQLEAARSSDEYIRREYKTNMISCDASG